MLLGALIAISVALSGCGAAPSAHPDRSATTAESGIGAWPTFLPSPSSEGVAHGSTASPALSYPGSQVVVSTGAGDVTVDVEGPAYPADTKIGAVSVPCTFAVTLGAATATVPLDAARFDVLDHTGATHPLKFAAGTLPVVLAPGRTVTVRLVATLPSGEGLLRFYPSGSHPAAGWDYVAETD